MFYQENLFSTNLPEKMVFNLPDADLTLFESFFTRQESDFLYKRLIENISWEKHQIIFYGKSLDLPRLSAWYGDSEKPYNYSGITMIPKAWNDDLKFIKTRIEKKSGVRFSSCLLNYYRTGKDSVSWHQDNEKELGKNPIIGSVSFGETRPFQLKHIDKKNLKRVDILLTHGSFLLMKGATQHYWKHQIPKTAKLIKPRVNLTFRIIKSEL